MEEDLATGELQPGLGIAQRRQGDGRLAGTGLTDKGDYLTRIDIKGNALDDGYLYALIVVGADLQVFDFE